MRYHLPPPKIQPFIEKNTNLSKVEGPEGPDGCSLGALGVRGLPLGGSSEEWLAEDCDQLVEDAFGYLAAPEQELSLMDRHG